MKRKGAKESHQCKINKIVTKAIKKMSKETGIFFHEDLEDDKYTNGQVEMVIELIPDSLSQVEWNVIIPIQSKMRHSVIIVPLVARGGYRVLAVKKIEEDCSLPCRMTTIVIM